MKRCLARARIIAKLLETLRPILHTLPPLKDMELRLQVAEGQRRNAGRGYVLRYVRVEGQVDVV